MRKLFLVESGILESGIQLKESGIPITTGIFSKAVVPTVGNLSSKVCPGVENFSLINFLIFYFFIKTLCSISKEQKHKLI